MRLRIAPIVDPARQDGFAVREEALGEPCILVLDEVQKAQGWPEQVKAEWDADTWASRDIRVVLLGSSPLLVQHGLTESLAGRFETVRSTHWTFGECRDAFGWDLDTFLFHGGYLGATRHLDDHDRWRAYILDAIVETTVSRDVLLLTRIDKPALLRRLFQLACEYSGQELSYRKMIGRLTDAGNTTTLAHYLDPLSGTGLVTGLQKHSSRPVQRRSSSPKLLVMNTALMTAMSGARFVEARADSALWGRIVESAVGAHLLAVAQREGGEVRYWRDGPAEVDFVAVHGRAVTAIEVKRHRCNGLPRHRGLSHTLPWFGRPPGRRRGDAAGDVPRRIRIAWPRSPQPRPPRALVLRHLAAQRVHEQVDVRQDHAGSASSIPPAPAERRRIASPLCVRCAHPRSASSPGCSSNSISAAWFERSTPSTRPPPCDSATSRMGGRAARS